MKHKLSVNVTYRRDVTTILSEWNLENNMQSYYKYEPNHLLVIKRGGLFSLQVFYPF